MRRLTFAFLLFVAPTAAQAGGLPLTTAQRADLGRIGATLEKDYGFSPAEVKSTFAAIRMQPEVLARMAAPAEALPWWRYRQIFITPARIAAGLAFWRAHRALLEETGHRYGVPPALLVAILGVETFYGEHMGHISVLDANATLFLSHPRGAFFGRQLIDFLRLCRDNSLDPATVEGSYAGAMGMPQFIASSYLHYAVDADGAGANLWNSVPDTLASVANYFRDHGWRDGEPVAMGARLGQGADPAPFLGDSSEPRATLSRLAEAGIHPAGEIADPPPATLLRLDGRDGPEYYLVWHNFRVIMRYNPSPLYAMAVWSLMERLQAAQEEPATRGTVRQSSTTDH